LFSIKTSDAKYVAVGIACQLLIAAAYWPFHFKNMNKPVDHIFGSVHGAMFVLLALLTTFAAPVIEELLFRGVVFRSLDGSLSNGFKKFGSYAAMALSAAIFAIAHAQLLQFAGLFALGIVLSYIVKKTNRLAPSILAHMSFNAVALVSLILQRTGH
jgi:membrane protease YdiL (CAAX protease family)